MLHGKGKGELQAAVAKLREKESEARWPNGEGKGLGVSFPRPSQVAGLRAFQTEFFGRSRWEARESSQGDRGERMKKVVLRELERERERESWRGLLEREFLHGAGEGVF